MYIHGHPSRNVFVSLCLLTLLLNASAFDNCATSCDCNTSANWHALRSLFNATNGKHWSLNYGWLDSSTPICCWYGVQKNCTALNLEENLLYGMLPAELAPLTGFTEVRLSKNFLFGTLPPSYASWVNLTLFVVSGNNFTGTLPSEYARWHKLEKFGCTANQFEGVLPESYANWTNLIEFDFSANHLNGTLPPAFASWTQLKEFFGFNNSIIGPLPESFANFSLLQKFVMFSNFLNGTLPTQYFVSWQKIKQFAVSGNFLSGTIPKQIENRTTLEVFVIDRNNFSGEVPLLPEVKFAALHRNSRLYGVVPTIVPSAIAYSGCETKLCVVPVVLALQFCQDITFVLDLEKIVETVTNIIKPSVVPLDVCTTVPRPTTRQPGNAVPPRASNTSVIISVSQVSQSYAVNYVAYAFGAVSSVFDASGVAVSVVRLGLLARPILCDAVAVMGEEPDVFSAPLGLSVGVDLGSYHRGAVLGNIVCKMMFVCITAIGVVSVRFAKRLPSWHEACAVVSAPGVWNIFIALLFPQLVLSSCVLLLVSPLVDSSASSIAVGITGVAVAATILAALVVLLVVRFTAHGVWRADDAEASIACVDGLAKWRQWIVWCVVQRIVWNPPESSTRRSRRDASLYYVQQFGMCFKSCTPACHWWLAADYFVTFVTCLCLSIAPHNCVASKWSLVAITGAWLAVTVVARPKHRRLALLNAGFSNAAAFVVACCNAAEIVNSDQASYICVFASCACGVMSVACQAADVWLARVVTRAGSRHVVRKTAAPQRMSRKPTDVLRPIEVSRQACIPVPLSCLDAKSVAEALRAVVTTICQMQQQQASVPCL